MLAYITPREAEFLRALDRRLSPRGEQFTYRGIPAFSHRGDVEAGTGRTADTYRDRNRGEREIEAGTGRVAGAEIEATSRPFALERWYRTTAWSRPTRTR